MFPFTLSGPPFLVFYLAVAVVLLAGYWFYRSSLGDAPPPARLTELTEDPYKIACLRGGEAEVVRIAIVNLVDRGLLGLGSASGTLLASGRVNPEILRRPLDRALIAHFATSSTPEKAMSSPEVQRLCGQYRQDLQGRGLLLDAEQRRKAFVGMVVVLGVLGGIAIARFLQAMSRGQGNIVFLIIIAACVCWFALRIGKGDTTSSGSRTLGSLETLLNRLKARAGGLAHGGATNEALLLAAVFGIYALPAGAFPFVEQMFPRPRSSSSDTTGGGSSGSSCGSGGGSSCGGGGGGCGGCGGG